MFHLSNSTSRIYFNGELLKKNMQYLIKKKRKQWLQTFTCITFYKLNVSYVTTYIIRIDYYSVSDTFKLKNTTIRIGN